MNEQILDATFVREDDLCPFANERVSLRLSAGECLWLKGNSGSGKTSLARALANLSPLTGTRASIEWNSAIPLQQRAGILFQQGVLIDQLNIQDNVALSAKAAGFVPSHAQIGADLKSVGLSDNDRWKMPGELSGGMLRRAALAQILAQNKRLVILDEPFVGLDPDTAQEVVDLLKTIKARGVAFLLISHEDHYASQLATPEKEVMLTSAAAPAARADKRRVAAYRFSYRFWTYMRDYFALSLPLIVCAFIAAGLAISMVFAQLLQGTDLASLIGSFQSSHTTFIERFIEHKIEGLEAVYLPIIRRKIYSEVLAQSFVTQLGPLLTALLLAGRIGASYSGEIGMMQATSQNALLQTLGVSPRRWTLLPAGLAALLSAPLLCIIGTTVCLFMAEWIALRSHLFPSKTAFWQQTLQAIFEKQAHFTDYTPFINLYRSLGFIILIMGVAETCSRADPFLPPRNVPKVITLSVVLGSLAVILADWGFTEWLFHAFPAPLLNLE